MSFFNSEMPGTLTGSRNVRLARSRRGPVKPAPVGLAGDRGLAKSSPPQERAAPRKTRLPFFL